MRCILHFYNFLSTNINMDNNWFNGAMADAISLVAQKQCVFLVYIHGKIITNSWKKNIQLISFL